MTIGERVRVLRKDMHMTQGEFGKRVSVTTATISAIEVGTTRPTERTLKDICAAFKVSRKWLDTGEGDMYAVEDTSVDMLTVQFAELLHNYPAIAELAKIAAARMRVDDWERLNEILKG